MKQNQRFRWMVLFLCFTSLTTWAQFKPHTLMLGTTIGSTAYSSSNSDYSYDVGGTRNTSTHSYTLSAGPQIGIFITSRLVVGGNLSLNYSNGNSNTSNVAASADITSSKSSTDNLTINLGPFFRYYFSNLKARNWFYAQVNATAGTGKGNSSGSAINTTTYNNSTGRQTNIFNWNTGASLGMTHLFYNRIGMDFALGYNYAHQKSTNANTTYTTSKITGNLSTSTNNYMLATSTNGITASIGFHFFL